MAIFHNAPRKIHIASCAKAKVFWCCCGAVRLYKWKSDRVQQINAQKPERRFSLANHSVRGQVTGCDGYFVLKTVLQPLFTLSSSRDMLSGRQGKLYPETAFNFISTGRLTLLMHISHWSEAILTFHTLNLHVCKFACQIANISIYIRNIAWKASLQQQRYKQKLVLSN